MATFSLRQQDGRDSLVITETDGVESVYVEQPAMRTIHGCYPIGHCDCPSKNFDGVHFETATIVGARALIDVGIVAIPVAAYCVGEHVAVKYTVSGKGAMVWICNNQTPGVILAHCMHGVAKYCDPRLENDIRKRTSSRNVELFLATPDVDPSGHVLKTIPLIDTKSCCW